MARGFLPDGQTTIASVVVIDLQTGEELSINPDVAYSSMSTIKIPILLNIFRKSRSVLDTDTKWLMGASILCSNNSASNYLMQLSGAGNNPGDQLADGLAKVTETVQQLGAKNTYISAPLYVADKAYQFQIPAPKTKPDIHFNASPDTYSHTTANDMASLLHETYDCSEYGSGLIAVFPDSYTQSECKQMIELMSGNIIGRMIELGVPPGTRVAQNGWGVRQATIPAMRALSIPPAATTFWRCICGKRPTRKLAASFRGKLWKASRASSTTISMQTNR